MNDNPIEGDINKQRYDCIASQINREDSLINYRLTWTLTLNGFLFAALGFLGSKDCAVQDIYTFFRWALPLTGIIVSFAGFCGVLAAHLQIHYLTKEWAKLNDSRWVRPFGEKRLSFWLGTLPCFLPSFILIVIWLRLSIIWKFWRF
jgi:hypothetical protein